MLRIFKIVLCSRDRYVFTWQSLKILRVFITLTFKQVFWKTKPCFRKLEYRFLLESTITENVTFPYKTVLSKTNAMTYRKRKYKIDLTKRTEFFKELLYFFEHLISLQEPLINTRFNVPTIQMSKCWYQV